MSSQRATKFLFAHYNKLLFDSFDCSDPSQQMSRVCYVKYIDPMNVSVAQHLTNTVFIDRAIFVKPVSDGMKFLDF